jgi:transposase-like protein
LKFSENYLLLNFNYILYWNSFLQYFSFIYSHCILCGSIFLVTSLKIFIESGSTCFFVKSTSLLPIIEKIVLPGTIIHSDEWRSYRRIQENLGLQHKTVNHSLWFVDKNTKVHTQTIESYWNRQKRYIKNMLGCRQTHLEHYLIEYMYRERHRENCFFDFCETISSHYPVWKKNYTK